MKNFATVIMIVSDSSLANRQPVEILDYYTGKRIRKKTFLDLVSKLPLQMINESLIKVQSNVP